MWTFTKVLLTVGLIASASATWRPIVGPSSSSSFNSKAPFGDSHTYYGNEFLSEYAALDHEHLLVPSVKHQHAPALLASSDSLSAFGSDVNNNSNSWIDWKEYLQAFLAPQDKCLPQKYALEYEGTLQFDQTLPSLDQFTLCNWMRFTNHTGDHTVFTYSRKYSISLVPPPKFKKVIPFTTLTCLFIWEQAGSQSLNLCSTKYYYLSLHPFTALK